MLRASCPPPSGPRRLGVAFKNRFLRFLSNLQSVSVVRTHLYRRPSNLSASIPCNCTFNWWREVDSNHRRRKPADLQSAPVGRLGIPPTKNGYCVDRGVMCQHLNRSKRPIFLDFPAFPMRLFSRFRHCVYRPIAPCSWRALADAAPSLADDVRCHRAASKRVPA